LLKADTVVTSNTPPDREQGLYGDPLVSLWKNNILVSCGVKNYFCRDSGVIITSTLEQRRQWPKEEPEITKQQFPG
jgi:hypothetical protein